MTELANVELHKKTVLVLVGGGGTCSYSLLMNPSMRHIQVDTKIVVISKYQY